MAGYVGYPQEKVLADREEHTRLEISLAPPDEKSWVELVASISFTNHELLLFPLEGGVDDYLPYGPGMLNRIDKSYGYPSLSLEEWSKNFPVGGFHIDVEAKRLEFWHAEAISNLTRKLRTVWSGWEVVNQCSSYASQLKCTHGLLQFQDINQRQLLEHLIAMLLRESSNPVDAVASFLEKAEAAGKKVEVNPFALRNDRYELPRHVKEEILNEAIGKL